MPTILVNIKETAAKSAIEELCQKESYQCVSIEKVEQLFDKREDKTPDILILEINEVNGEIIQNIKKIRDEPCYKTMDIFTYLDGMDVKTEVQLRKVKINSFFLKNEQWGIPALIKGIVREVRQIENQKIESVIPEKQSAQPTSTQDDGNGGKENGVGILADQFDYMEAGASAEKVVEENFKHGRTFMEEGEFGEALTSFEKVAESSKMYIPALHMRGVCYIRMGKKEQAVPVLLKALKTTGPKKERAEAGYELGKILREIGRKKDALKVFELVHKIDPGFSGITEEIENLKLEI